MWLEPMSYSLRERDVEVTMAIDHELDIWPNRIPHGLDGAVRGSRHQASLGDKPLGLLAIGPDIQRRLPFDQREEAVELRLHPRGILFRRIGKPECVGSFSKSSQPCIRSQANDQPHSPFRGPYGEQFDSRDT